MNKLLIIIYIFVSVIFLGYLLLPNPDFPKPPPDSVQSDEPSDLETPFRRGYFTNYTREQVMEWYKSQLDKSVIYNITLPTYRLNYPPETAKIIIRDQTASTFLEEIAHPFRESVYVNGYEPKGQEDLVVVKGQLYRQKIIIRFVPSLLAVRIAVFVGIVFFTIIIANLWTKTLFDLKDKKIKI